MLDSSGIERGDRFDISVFGSGGLFVISVADTNCAASSVTTADERSVAGTCKALFAGGDESGVLLGGGFVVEPVSGAVR